MGQMVRLMGPAPCSTHVSVEPSSTMVPPTMVAVKKVNTALFGIPHTFAVIQQGIWNVTDVNAITVTISPASVPVLTLIPSPLF